MLASASARGGTATCSGRHLSARRAWRGGQTRDADVDVTETALDARVSPGGFRGESESRRQGRRRRRSRSARPRPVTPPRRRASPAGGPHVRAHADKAGGAVQVSERRRPNEDDDRTLKADLKAARWRRPGPQNEGRRVPGGLARRRAAKQAEARHLETLKSFGRGARRRSSWTVIQRVRLRCRAKAGLGLKEAFMAGDLETAQRRLVNELDTLGAHKGYGIVCVFDADRTANSAAAAARRKLSARPPRAPRRADVGGVLGDQRRRTLIERASIEELAGVSSVDAVLRKTRQANGGASRARRSAPRTGTTRSALARTSGDFLARRRTAGLDAVKRRCARCRRDGDNALLRGPRQPGAHVCPRVAGGGADARAEGRDGDSARVVGEGAVGRREARADGLRTRPRRTS